MNKKTIKDIIIEAIWQSINSEDSKTLFINKQDIVIEKPNIDAHGDYSSNIALQAFTVLKNKDSDGSYTGVRKYPSNISGTDPRVFATNIIKRLKKNRDLLKVIDKDNITVAGPGFINFFIKQDYLIKELQTILSEGEKYGTSDLGNGRLAIVEYSSPNIAKPFTVGHFRSTIIGDAVANLLEATGWKVMRDNHLGDWGTQFGKQIYAIKTWGDEDQIAKSENPVKELVQLYVKFHDEAEKDPSIVEKGREWFKKLEQGDEEARRIWKLCIDWSFKEFDRIYKLLDVDFNDEFEGGRGLGESFFEDKMQVVIDELEKKDLLKEGEGGAKLVFFPDEKYPPAMILKSNGTTLYHTRDLATDLYRAKQYDPDLIVNEVGAEQTLYFKQLFEMEQMLGWFEEGQRVHVAHGLIRFKEGKMSTRKGNVIWLEELISQAIEKAKSLSSNKGKTGLERPLVLHSEFAHGKQQSEEEFSEFQDELAIEVGIGALKWNDLKREPKTEITFDWDEILSMQGNSGPYLQYTYARCQSVLDKADKDISRLNSVISEILKQVQDDKMSLNDEELALLRSYPNYSEVIANASNNYSPNLLCNYLYDLAQKYNTYYNAHKIVGGENEGLGLALTVATGIILKNGLSLLGIKSPEKM